MLHQSVATKTFEKAEKVRRIVRVMISMVVSFLFSRFFLFFFGSFYEWNLINGSNGSRRQSVVNSFANIFFLFP